jgi:hypothetical protein
MYPKHVFHHPSSPGRGKRRKLACSVGSPYSRQALGKSTGEPIFIFQFSQSPYSSPTAVKHSSSALFRRASG